MDFFLEPHVLEALREGRFEFAHALHPLLAVLVVAALGGCVWWLYRSTTRPVANRWRHLFIGLRVTVLLLLFLMLLRPSVTTEQVRPQETWLAVVVDDSASMTVTDTDQGSRLNSVRQALEGENGLVSSLSELFQVRLFGFDRDTRRLESAQALQGGGNDSRIGQALSRVNEQLGGLALGGVVVVSDGADASGEEAVNLARDLGARDVPVFTLGVGQEEIARDISIVDVQADSTILDDEVFTVQVEVRQRGYADQPMELRILDGETEVASQNIQLAPDGATRRYELTLEPARREAIVYDAILELQDGERIAPNNRYPFLVDNSRKPPLNLLYVEGHPRNEYKFIRRAAGNDDNLRLASLLETGPGRLYRQGLDNARELSGGFPDDREDLYAYAGLVIGDVGRDFFTAEQLEMIRGFVDERGGGLLVSGMVEDTLTDSPLAEMLPLSLVRSDVLPDHLQGGIRRGSHATGELYNPRLTADGALSPLLRLDDNESGNRARWAGLPALQGIYATGRPKPGATVLMEHPTLTWQGRALPVLATQRYGSGRTVSLTTASTWRWQMLMDSSDDSHERLWRQMLRWLSASAPSRIELTFDEPFYHTGDEVNVTARVRDDQYRPDNDAAAWLQVVDAEGNVEDRQMEWDIDEDGVYRTRFVAASEGVHRATVDSTSTTGPGLDEEVRGAFVVTPSRREFVDPGLDRNLLSRLAEAGGGRYYDIGAHGRLLDDIEYTPSAFTEQVREDLWDQPVLLLLLIALLCADWVLRRQKGLS
ncbi:MAG: hypothetical protein WEB57_06725 [Pseudohongiellaceae bacterium]